MTGAGAAVALATLMAASAGVATAAPPPPFVLPPPALPWPFARPQPPAPAPGPPPDAAPAPAAPPPAALWRPSGSAINITGPMSLSPEHLTAAGADFPLRVAAMTRGAIVFAVTAPANPPLINGNRLCGPRAPTWIVAAPIAPHGLELAVFANVAAPTGPGSPGVCATYFYDR